MTSDTRELQDRFHSFDTNGDGRIDGSEFEKLLAALGIGATAEFALIAFSAIDVDGSGSIDFAEFSGWWRARLAKRSGI